MHLQRKSKEELKMSEEEKRMSEIFGGGQVIGVYNESSPVFRLLISYLENPNKENYDKFMEVFRKSDSAMSLIFEISLTWIKQYPISEEAANSLIKEMWSTVGNIKSTNTKIRVENGKQLVEEEVLYEKNYPIK